MDDISKNNTQYEIEKFEALQMISVTKTVNYPNNTLPDKYPKTDYTYSQLSRDRVELAPGQIAVPNMSRLSLNQYRQGMTVHNGGLAEDESLALHARTEELRKRWTSHSTSHNFKYNNYRNYKDHADSDYDEVDMDSRTLHSTNRRWWITRLLLLIYSTIVTSITTVKNTLLRHKPINKYPYYSTSSNHFSTSQNTTLISRVKKLITNEKFWILFLLLLLPLLYYLFGFPFLFPIYLKNNNTVVYHKTSNFELTDEILNKIVLHVKENLPEVPSPPPEVIERIIEKTENNNIDLLTFNQLKDLVNNLYTEIDVLKEQLKVNTDLNPKVIPLIEQHSNKLLADVFGLDIDGSSISHDSVKAWIKKENLSRKELESKLTEITKSITDDLNQNVLNLIKSELKEHQNKHLIGKTGIETSMFSNGVCNCEEVVHKIVGGILAVYDADKTGLVDYALESAGGQVISTRCTESYQPRTAVYTIFSLFSWYPFNSPRTVITPGTMPGECWAFQDFPGYLVLKLHTRINVTGFTLEHTPVQLSPTGRIDSAPKKFTVLGLKNLEDSEPFEFGTFEYRNNSTPLQYFPVANSINASINDPPGHELIELKIHSNHDHPQYTCLYRFRVHGDPVGDISNGNIPER